MKSSASASPYRGLGQSDLRLRHEREQSPFRGRNSRPPALWNVSCGRRYHRTSYMSELKSLSPEILLHIAQDANVPMKGLVATIELLDEGATVPFIARHRKQPTATLAAVHILNIAPHLTPF